MPNFRQTLTKHLMESGYKLFNKCNGTHIFLKPINDDCAFGVRITGQSKFKYQEVAIGIVLVEVERVLTEAFGATDIGLSHLTYTRTICHMREWSYLDEEEKVIEIGLDRLINGLGVLEESGPGKCLESKNALYEFRENQYFSSPELGAELSHYHAIRKLVLDIINTGKLNEEMIQGTRNLLSENPHQIEAFDLQVGYVCGWAETNL
ncbi:MAG: hypothetical protein ABW096_20500 [Candidatus Thiodiazotropha sp.]